MRNVHEPEEHQWDFWRGVFYGLPIALGLWSLILVFGTGLGWLVDQLVDDLVDQIHIKLALSVVLIFCGLYALEAAIKWVAHKWSRK